MSALLRLLAAVALVLGPAIAPAAASAQAPPPDITDAAFLAAAAQSNRFEIITGDLASKRGKHRVVRRLGRQFEKHHTMALADGAKVAAKLGIPVPGGVNAEQAAAIDKLRDLRGRRFDRAWLKAQLVAHEQAVVLHQRAALNGDTADVRTLAVLALPVVSVHLGELLAVTG